MGEKSSVSFDIVDSPDNPDIPEIGHRSSSVSIIGYIDRDTESIILPEELTGEILSYEL